MIKDKSIQEKKTFIAPDLPAAALQPRDKESYLVKEGGNVHTWKMRYFILSGKFLYW